MFKLSGLISATQLGRISTRVASSRGPISQFNRYASQEAKETYTKLSDENDPQRDTIFKYTWGTWLKNDEAEKKKRFTKFSLTGLQDILKLLVEESKTTAQKTEDVKELPKVSEPKRYFTNFVSLPHNVNVTNFGSLNPNENLHIKQLSSLHEGKHHRIYKIDLNTERSFILRIPYPLDTEYAIEKRIQSEAATLDFISLKTDLKVPKVFAYGADNTNPLNIPFILEEFIEGDTLMKKWQPMTPHTESNHKEVIGEVINPLSELQSKLSEIEFNQFGSLYFAIDSAETNPKEPYNGETDEALKGRWVIGPSTERVFWRNRHLLRPSQFESLVGPWDADKPLDIVKSVAEIELETLRTRLAFNETDAGVIEDKDALKQQIEVYEHLKSVAPVLINTKSEGVKNIEQLFKPRLAHTDIDPLNVLTKGDDYYFLDFEGATIKPIIFQSTPRFVAYEDGPKIYEFEIDMEKYETMSDADKYYYDFAVVRTRNEFLWDVALANTFNKLETEGSPVLKRLRAPYTAAIEKRTDNESAIVDRKIYEIALQWNQFAEHKFVLAEQFPFEITDEKFDAHTKVLEKYYNDLGNVPFAVTGGWVPQDMFESLLSQNVIIKQENGDYAINDEVLGKAEEGQS
ncbi:hypothetical protein BN7_3821 [Wickerhamomyces ciferrii]|uniref:Altered inheritance of mitochondria protein 9, mitochondrial n=1 Tax=Wickerhamomyces ciferrii (strain ATCC 14091 / BCRC 22168 / CBS 111 / JCM 3599 / NBRC 0793 / NRRL Y-1031 F-60-10) TaxID=1206466 RepID=K0KGI6_WICCF|nr:uncharacterized protein BN7_3821 [Wickerhamomyces ciferrii]CCH44260.1 hypothetical protein BN7_3821 [Wickerhamomyces ciferrii]